MSGFYTNSGMNPAIKLRHIRCFLAVVTQSNVTQAAGKLGLTQPALSRSLAELETLLGRPLFLRIGRRLHLTEAGHLFHRYASLATQTLDAGARAIAPQHQTTLRIGVLPTAATRLFPTIALRFRALAPDTILNVESGPHLYLMRLLREGALDLVIGRMPQGQDMADLSFTHLYEESIVLVGRANHPLAGRTIKDVLAKAPLILPPKDAIIRVAVDDYLTSLGLAGLDPAFTSVSHAFGRGVVLRSDAVWFISRGVVLEDIERGDMAAFAVGDRYLNGAVGITRRRHAPVLAGLEILIQVTEAAARAPNTFA